MRGEDGAVRELPAEYVEQHVQLAYGSTVHAAQGATVDRGYVVTDGRSDAAALYVGLTRGRERNIAFVALTATDPDAVEAAEDRSPRPTARSVREDALEHDQADQAAHVHAEADAAREASTKTLLGRIELVTQTAVRARMETDLDQLVADGLLSAEDRARLSSDQSSGHLSRLLRAAEQAGHDPQQILREAVAQRSMDGAQSVAQVLSARITAEHDIETAGAGRAIPKRLPAAHAEYLELLLDLADDRARALGSEVAEQQPAWATAALGAVPADAVERLEWETRAGQVAAYREAIGFEEPARALPSAPGMTTTETRAAWWQAWDALGRPSEQRAEAALSDGQLRARVSAWQREQQWAPAHADAALRDAELRAADARTEAILAAASGDHERAAELHAEVERLTAVARGTDAVADARAGWAAETSVTRDLAERAEGELAARGVAPGAEPDRVDAETWLAEQRRAAEAEDAHRLVTELDLPVADDDETAWDNAPSQAPPALDEVTQPRVPSRAHDVAPLDPDDLELAALTHTAVEAEERIADRESEQAAHDAFEAELAATPEHGQRTPTGSTSGTRSRRWPLRRSTTCCGGGPMRANATSWGVARVR